MLQGVLGEEGKGLILKSFKTADNRYCDFLISFSFYSWYLPGIWYISGRSGKRHQSSKTIQGTQNHYECNDSYKPRKIYCQRTLSKIIKKQTCSCVSVLESKLHTWFPELSLDSITSKNQHLSIWFWILWGTGLYVLSTNIPSLFSASVQWFLFFIIYNYTLGEKFTILSFTIVQY